MAKEQSLEVIVVRGSSDNHQEETFVVPAHDNQTVLDVVSWIQQYSDPTLSYRFSCRVGMCGSCAMMVHGKPRWTCRTHVKKVLQNSKLHLAPLRNLPVIKDLAVDMEPFFAKWIKAEGKHHASQTRFDPIAEINPENPARLKANAGIECINCSICYAACDTVAGNADYLGPAALLRAWTLYQDEKNHDKAAILDAVSGIGGCHNCHAMGSCHHYCPNELQPLAAIAELKRETAKAFLRGKNNA